MQGAGGGGRDRRRSRQVGWKLSLVVENPQGQKGGVFCVADPDRCDGTSRWELHDSVERIDSPQWTDIERQSDDRHIGERGNRAG